MKYLQYTSVTTFAVYLPYWLLQNSHRWKPRCRFLHNQLKANRLVIVKQQKTGFLAKNKKKNKNGFNLSYREKYGKQYWLQHSFSQIDRKTVFGCLKMYMFLPILQKLKKWKPENRKMHARSKTQACAIFFIFSPLWTKSILIELFIYNISL